MNRSVIRSSARAIIYKVYVRCLAKLDAEQILSELNDVFKRTAEMTGKSNQGVSCSPVTALWRSDRQALYVKYWYSAASGAVSGAYYYYLKHQPQPRRHCYVPRNANICHPCYELLNSEATSDVRLFGHTMVRITCGRSVRIKQCSGKKQFNVTEFTNVTSSFPSSK